ncbi:LysR family transcriptional regulator [Myxococcota bacterium]|nr:LysR family transcriptional regulator [Myxococcota bacterium]MBU1430935.1 LysR family transcriptional regulator [Myxococcota bacterium]MBU1899534.1 LysR family transcriptional regulator [Myxococcota bacterium]
MIHPQDLPHLATFAAVAREGSFTAAAAKLNLSRSVVSAQVQALEARWRVRLLERTTRRSRLTPAGISALACFAEVEASMGVLERGLEAARDAPTGRLRVTTTHDLATTLLAPVAAALIAQHPGLDIEIIADDETHDLIEGGFDLAIRLGAPRDSSYVMRRVATFEEPIVAAPALAARFAGVTDPAGLSAAPWVRHTLIPGGRMRFRGPGGVEVEISTQARGSANSGAAVRALLLGGAGIGVLPSYQIEADLTSGALKRLCPAWTWRAVSLYVLQPDARHPRRVVRLFIERLISRASAPTRPAAGLLDERGAQGACPSPSPTP